MQKHVLFGLASLGVAVAAVQVSACGLSVSGLDTASSDSSVPDVRDGGPADVNEASQQDRMVSDGGDASDGEMEAAACNAQNCGGTCCGTTCLPQQGCGGCDAAAFCPFGTSPVGAGGYCVSDCSGCSPDDAGFSTACWSCADSGASGRCFPNSNSCPTAMGTACGCSHASDCPGASQVCAGQVCLTCGQAGTDNQDCANGMKCDAPSGLCNK